MDRLKSFLSFWPVILIVAAILGIGWSANALKESKVDVAVYDPFKEKTENRLTTNEVTVKFVIDDLKLIKEQSRQTAMTVGARVVIPAPDGGVK